MDRNRGSSGPLSNPVAKLSEYDEIGRNELANGDCEDNELSPADMSLEDLPTELILSIISKLDYGLHNRIRCASKGLNKIYILYMMHVFRIGLHRSSTQNSEVEGVVSVAYQVLNTATEHFLTCGYESQFCGSLVALHNCTTVDSFSPRLTKLCSFLVHFYEVVEKHLVTAALKPSCPSKLTFCNRIGVNEPNYVADRNLTLNSIGFTYTLTLMNLLKKFKNFRVYSIKNFVTHASIVIELWGIYLGVLLVNSRRRPRCFAFLSIISELLYGDLTQQPINRVWDQRNIIYIYGSSNPLHKRTSCTYFKFNIHASSRILHIICSMLVDGLSERNSPQKISNYPFRIDIEIKCKTAIFGGCCDTINLKIQPFATSIDDLSKEESGDNVLHSNTLT